MSKEDVVEKKKFRNALLIAAIPVVMGLVSLTVSLHSNTSTRKVEILRKEIEVKNAKLEQLNIAMVDIRAFLLSSQTKCKDKKYIGDYIKLRSDLILIIFKLVNASFAANLDFDLDSRQQVSAFVSRVFDNSEICSTNYPSDNELRKDQVEINKHFITEIKVAKDRMESLERGLFY